MNPVRASLRHPQVTLVLTGMLFVLGAFALLNMPRREDPKITIRTGVVMAIYPGATAEQVESQVTRKIEERLFRFAEVRKQKTFSTSRTGICFVNVELEDFVRDADTFWSKLRLDLAQLRQTDLPDQVRGPVVDSDFGDTVAVLIAVHGGYGYRELKDYAERIEAELRTIRAVSKIRRLGEQKEQIEITSSLERLSQYAVNPLKVAGALQGRNTVQFAGAVPTGQAKVPIRTTGPFQTEDEIRRVMIDVSPLTGQPVYIGDLARVERTYKDPTRYGRLNGSRAVMLSVEMQEGNNIVEFGKTLRARLDGLRPALPPDLRIDLIADQPSVVAHRIREFIREFGIAIASVILVTMLLLPLRVAVISAIAIPVTVAITFGMLNAFGIELHQVSISALIVVLGMVVDDAIVIADNYVELLDQKVPLEAAAFRSAWELAVPVLTATLTIIGSFLPLLMLSGAIGEFIRALPIAVAIALLSSYVVAMLLTPLLARFFIKKGLHDHAQQEPKRSFSPLDLMQRAYSAAMKLALRHRGLVVAGAVGTVVAGVFLLKLAPEQFFPSAERNQFVVDVWLPEGTKIEATDATVKRIEEALRREPQTLQYASFLGGSAPRFYYNVNPQAPAANYAQILVNTKSAGETPEVVHRLRAELARTAPEARTYVKLLQQGKLMEAPVEVRISGSEVRGLREIGARVSDILRATPGAIYVHDDYREDAYDLNVDVRQEVANRLGITNASLAQQLAGGFDGAPVTTFWEGDRDVDVVLRLNPERRSSFANVGDTYVMSLLTGAKVPVGTIATLKPEWKPARIVRRNGVRTLTVRAFPESGRLASEVLKAARPQIDAVPLPGGYRVEYGGELENQMETFSEMVHALAISLVAIFLILLFQFRSISDPAIVMMSIPLALPGAALGLLATRNPFGFTAFMGIVSLGGIVVRNAIILIDYIRERMDHGACLEEAAREAGERRLRPIFLTTMAAAVGVTPMILSGSSLWSPLASVIAFGLLVSMFFTLVAIPVIYTMVHGRQFRAAPAMLAVVAVLAVCAPAAAETRKIALDEAVSLAMRNNAHVKLAGLKAREAQAKVGGAAANYYPQVVNDTMGMRMAERQRLEIPSGGLGVYPSAGPIPGAAIPIPLGEQNLLLSTTTVTQPITQFFRIRAGTKVAGAEVEIAKQDARLAENEVALKVKELYYGLLIAKERRRALALQIGAGEERLREARMAVEAGVALQLRVLDGEAQLAQARQALAGLDDSISDFTLEFNDLVGLPLDTEPELRRPPAASAAAPPGELLKTSLARHPEVLRAKGTVEKAKAGVAAARAEYIPEIGAFAQHIYQSGVPLLARHNAAAGLKMNVTLFEFGKRRALVREREAQVAQAQENLERIENRVRVEVEKAVRKLRRSDVTVTAAESVLAARKEAARVRADEVEAKTANTAALREAEAALALAQAELLQAELGRQTAAAELTRSAGSR